MKPVQKLKAAISIATLILSAKANANIGTHQEPEYSGDKNFENLNQESKLVGFAPEKALRTLESLAYAGAASFNHAGETQILSGHLPFIVRAATDDFLEVKILPSEITGYVKLKFSDALAEQARLSSGDLIRLKDMSEYFKLSCHGGGIVP